MPEKYAKKKVGAKCPPKFWSWDTMSSFQNFVRFGAKCLGAKCPWGILSWGILSFGAKCLGAKCLLANVGRWSGQIEIFMKQICLIGQTENKERKCKLVRKQISRPSNFIWKEGGGMLRCNICRPFHFTTRPFECVLGQLWFLHANLAKVYFLNPHELWISFLEKSHVCFKVLGKH